MNAITRQELAQLDAPLVSFSLNGREVTGRATETLLQVAQREGVEIPHLCYKEGMEAVGNCRACMVEINGERVLAPSCCRAPTPGMKVVTDSERAVASQKLVLELLLSDMPETAYTRHNEVDQWATKIGVGKPRFEARQQVRQDLTHPAIAVNLDACIQCTRCLRACRDEQVNDVIGLAFRGDQAKIVFDMDDPMGASTCVACACLATLLRLSWAMRNSVVSCWAVSSLRETTARSKCTNRPVRSAKSFRYERRAGTRPRSSSTAGRSSRAKACTRLIAPISSFWTSATVVVSRAACLPEPRRRTAAR